MPATSPKSFGVPVPRSRARSHAQEVLDRNRSEIERAVIDGSRRDLARILLQAQEQMRKKLAKTNPDAKWTVLDMQQGMRVVTDALGSVSPRFKSLLEAQHDEARARGCKSTAEMLTLFQGKDDNGTVRPLAIREALAMRELALDRHATSVDRYGVHMIQTIRRELQAGIVRGATFHEMTDLLVGRKGPRGTVSLAATVDADGKVRRLQQGTFNKGLFVERRGWAERIVRTEGMRAYNAGAHEENVAQKAKNFSDLKKKLIETFDSRTGKDSYAAHGQVRELEEMFVDGAGRRYLHPPGRPNDRGVEIPWRDAWSGRDAAGRRKPGTLDDDELEAVGETVPERRAAPPRAPDARPAARPAAMASTPPPKPPTAPATATRLPPARPDWFSSAGRPGARHFVEEMDDKSRASQGANSVALDRATVLADVAAIRRGGGSMAWIDEATRGVEINGRRYGIKTTGTTTLYPVDGPGILQLSQGEYLALRNFVTKNPVEAKAASKNDRRIAPEELIRGRSIAAILARKP